jgi:hypothetical protein
MEDPRYHQLREPLTFEYPADVAPRRTPRAEIP